MTRAGLLALTVALACQPREEAPIHEDPHEEALAVPGRVELAASVIEDAGLAWEAVAERRVAPSALLNGRVVADPDRRSRVSARLAGTVESTRKRPGEAVAKRDVIAVIRAPNLQALRSTESALRAKAASARANADRLSALVESRMASEQEAVAARAEADALEAEATAARDRLRAIGVRGTGRGPVLFQVRAPTDGILVERPVTEGDPVTADSIIATVVALDRVWFEAQIFERDLARLAVGDAASIALNAFPEDRFEGTLEYISHQPDSGALTLTARIPLDNPDGLLRLGLFGTAAIRLDAETGDPVLAIPPRAVTQLEGRDVVFTRESDTLFQARPVRLGRRDGAAVEILEGLEPGEHVVTEGVFAVKSVALSSTIAEDHH